MRSSRWPQVKCSSRRNEQGDRAGRGPNNERESYKVVGGSVRAEGAPRVDRRSNPTGTTIIWMRSGGANSCVDESTVGMKATSSGKLLTSFEAAVHLPHGIHVDAQGTWGLGGGPPAAGRESAPTPRGQNCEFSKTGGAAASGMPA